MPQYEDMQLSLGCMIGSNASSRTKLPYQCKYLCSCSYISVVHARHLTAICVWDSSPHLPVTAAQQIWPGLNWNKLCRVGHNIQACPFAFREMWLFFFMEWYNKHFYNLCRMSGVVLWTRCATMGWLHELSLETFFSCDLFSYCYLRAKNSSKIHIWWEIESSNLNIVSQNANLFS